MTSQSGGASGFDPRFNPAFQPGYQPAPPDPVDRFTERPPARGAVVQADPSAAAQLYGRPDAAPSPRAATPQPTLPQPPIADPHRTGLQGAATFAPTLVDGADLSPVADPGADGYDATGRRSGESPRGRTNPFVIALGVLSVLFVLLGIGAMRWMVYLTEQPQETTNSYFQWVYTLQTMGPMLVILGLAVGSSILVIYASRWKSTAP